MKKIRVIGRIDVKNESAIKGIQLEGLRKVGLPNELAVKYYTDGIDELIFMDAVAAYYDRNSLFHIIKDACADIFVPITVGGGIRNLFDIQNALNSGADKVAINTAAIRDPDFITQAAKTFGSQCIVVSIDAKRTNKINTWEAYTDNGREASGLDVISWVEKAEQLGAGEVFLTSIDRDGTKKGFDVELNQFVSKATSIPITVSGGAGSLSHLSDLIKKTCVDGICLASILHYNIESLVDIKKLIKDAGYEVRL